MLVTSLAMGEPEPIESRTVARRMAEQASTLYDSGQYEPARDLFHRANLLFAAPTLELWEGRALEKLGRLVEAEERYIAVKHYRIRPEDSEVVHAAIREATTGIEDLRKRIPTITIMLRGANPEDPKVGVEVDGRRLNPALLGYPLPVDPGPRTVRLVVKGREIRRVEVTVKERDREPIDLDASNGRASSLPTPIVSGPRGSIRPIEPQSAASHRSAPSNLTRWFEPRNVGWMSVGLGVAGLGVGMVTGGVAVSKHKTLNEHCRDDRCPPEYAEELDSFRAYRTASTVGYVIGGVGIAAGVTILLVVAARSQQKVPAEVALQLTPTSAMLGGRF
jgi:hypothetical protein